MFGIALERAGQNLRPERILEQLIGFDLTYRWRHVGITTRLLLTPKIEYQNIRAVFGLGARGYWDMIGTEWSFGVGATAEARLDDHFGLAHIVPAELGAAIYRKGPFRTDLRVGLRYLVFGELIDNFLIDPNGFNNDNARVALADKKDSPWDVFVTLAFNYELN